MNNAGVQSRAGVSPASLVERIWHHSGLSQAELARRAGMPRSVLNVYLHDRRRPGSDALLRIAAAAGLELQFAPRTSPVDTEEAGRRLVQVLELAEALPFRPRAHLDFPGLPRMPSARGQGR